MELASKGRNNRVMFAEAKLCDKESKTMEICFLFLMI